MNHNQSSTPKPSPCQPESFRAFKAELRVRWQMSAFRMAFMPPRMMPDQPILSIHDLLEIGASLITCRERDEAGIAHTKWHRYDTWRAFIRHVRKLGLPAFYLRGH